MVFFKEVSMNNERGSAIVLSLVILFIISTAGGVMLMSTRMDKTNQISYTHRKIAQQATITAFKASEGSFADDPVNTVAILDGYLKNPSNKWLFSSASGAGVEHKISMNGDPGSPKYSANIVGFGVGYGTDGVASLTPFIKIEGIGYGKLGKENKGIALYSLKGISFATPASPRYAIYIAVDGYDFNQPVHLIGDMYFGGGFRFNSNANGSVIDGNIKTASKSTVSEFNGGVTINGNAFFQTPIKIQNYEVKVNGNGGFSKNIELSKNLVLGGDGYFNNSTISGSSKVDLTNHTANYYSSTSTRFINYTPSEKNSLIDIPDKLEMPAGDDPPPVFNINLLSSYTVDVNFTNFTATEIQSAYDNTPVSKRWNGYMVMRIKSTSNVQFNGTSGIFNGKVIWIIEKSLGVNGNWYASSSTASTIMYVKDGGNISQLGWSGCMKGYIYVTGTGSITYAFKSGSSFEGSINHVNGSGFQVNTSNTITIKYDEPFIDFLSAKGLVAKTIYTLSPKLKLVDAQIRPELMSIQL
jgi:hypothetical protein